MPTPTPNVIGAWQRGTIPLLGPSTAYVLTHASGSQPGTLQSVMDNERVVRLMPGNYEASATGSGQRIILRSGVQVYGHPGLGITRLPWLEVEAGATDCVLSGVHTRGHDPPNPTLRGIRFLPGAVTRRNLFVRICVEGVVDATGASTEENDFFSLYLAQLIFDNAAGGYCKNNRYQRIRAAGYDLAFETTRFLGNPSNKLLNTGNVVAIHSLAIPSGAGIQVGYHDEWTGIGQGFEAINNNGTDPLNRQGFWCHNTNKVRVFSSGGSNGDTPANFRAGFYDVGAAEWWCLASNTDDSGMGASAQKPHTYYRAANLRAVENQWYGATTVVDERASTKAQLGRGFVADPELENVPLNGVNVSSGSFTTAQLDALRSMFVTSARQGERWERPDLEPIPGLGPAATYVADRAGAADSLDVVQGHIDAGTRIPAGVYYCSASPQMSSGQRFFGSGWDQTYIVVKNPAHDLVVSRDNFPEINPGVIPTAIHVGDLQLVGGTNGIHLAAAGAGPNAQFVESTVSHVVVRDMSNAGFFVDRIGAFDACCYDHFYFKSCGTAVKSAGDANDGLERPYTAYMDGNTFAFCRVEDCTTVMSLASFRQNTGNCWINSVFKNATTGLVDAVGVDWMLINCDFENAGGDPVLNNQIGTVNGRQRSWDVVGCDFVFGTNTASIAHDKASFEDCRFSLGSGVAVGTKKIVSGSNTRWAHLYNCVSVDVPIGTPNGGLLLNTALGAAADAAVNAQGVVYVAGTPTVFVPGVPAPAPQLLRGVAFPSTPPVAPPPTGSLLYRDEVLADAPWGYWRLDDAGTTAVDSAGANDGTYAGGYTQGLVGATLVDANAAVGFDGVTGTHVALPTYGFPGSWSFACWAWANDLTADHSVFGVGDAVAPFTAGKELMVRVTSEGRLWLNFYGAGNVESATGLFTPGAWHHVVVTYLDAVVHANPGTTTLYLDGVQVAQSTTIGPWTGTAPELKIGTWREGDNQWRGRLDDAALYPAALSSARVTAHRDTALLPPPVVVLPYQEAVLSDAPWGYWRLDETGGTVAVDLAGSNDGTYAGGVTLGTPGALSVEPVTAVGFDGVTGTHVALPTYGFPGSWSFACWAYANDTGTDHSFFGVQDATDPFVAGKEMYLRVTDVGRLRMSFYGGADVESAAGLFTPGVWHFVVVTYEADVPNTTPGITTLYLDGAQVAQSTAIGPWIGVATPNIKLGTWISGDNQWRGRIDEAALYATVLSQARVTALRDIGLSPPYTPAPPVPAAPTGLTAPSVTATSVGLAWTDVATNETGYEIERSASSSAGPWTLLATLPGGTVAHTDSTVAGGTNYWYRVFATNATGFSAPSNVYPVTTPAVVLTPAAPTGLTAPTVTAVAVGLSWSDNATNETNYVVERSTAGASGPWSVLTVPALAANATAYSDTTVSASATYWYRARATNASGGSLYSNVLPVAVPAASGGAAVYGAAVYGAGVYGATDVAPVVAPTGLTAVLQSPTSIALAWVDNATNETAYQVEYASAAAGPWVLLIALPANTAAYTDTGVPAGTTRHYQVRATNATGASAYAGPVNATTPATDTTPPVVSTPVVTAVTPTSAVLLFSTDDQSTSRLQYGATTSYGGLTATDPVLRTSHARTVSPLLANTLYHARAEAWNAAGLQGFSADVAFTTPVSSGGAVPAPPASGALMPGVQVLLALESRPLEEPVWTDVSPYVRACFWKRGRENELGQISAGTGTVVLDNRDRRFDPTNAAGPYYGNLKRMRRVRIICGWDGAGYDQITGFCGDWPLSWQGPQEATVALPFTDGFEVLAQTVLNGPFPAERSDERIHAVLDLAAWTTGAGWLLGHPTQSILGSTTVLGSTGDRLIDVGDTRLQPAVLTEVNGLQHAQQVEATERGMLFMAKGGQVRFRSRHELRQLAVSPACVFGNDEAAGELLFAPGTSIEAAGGPLYNRARVTREGGATQTFQDDESILDHYPRTLTLTTLHDSDVEAGYLASALVAEYKQPAPRVALLPLDPVVQPAQQWPHVLGLELGQVITLRATMPGGGPRFEQRSRLEGIECAYQAGNTPDAATWRITWKLSPVSSTAPWILGDPQYSILGQTTILVH